MTGPQSAQCIASFGDAILRSGVPGVIVLNLHPQNVDDTRDMHDAVRHLIVGRQFVPMTLGACLDWFAERDRALQW